MEQMQVTTNNTNRNWMKFISFRDIALWDVKILLSQNYLSSEFDFVSLSEILKQVSRIERIEEGKEYKLLGIRSYGKGIFHRDIKMGREIKAKTIYKVKTGDLIYSRLGASNGSFGIVDDSFDGYYVSNEFPTFTANGNEKQFLNEFLFLVLSSQIFRKSIADQISGSAHKRFHEDKFLKLRIPLPDIDNQQKIVHIFYQRINEAYKQENEATSKELEINTYLLDLLGVTIKNTLKKKGINFTKFSFIDRWAADYLFNLSSIKGITEAKYPTQKVRNFMLSYQYGLSSKATEEPIGIPMLRMNNIYNSELSIDKLKYIFIPEEKNKKILLDKGDLLFNRTNSKELVGKTAVFELDGKFTFASYLIRLKLDTEKVNVHFINYLFNSPIGRMQIDMISRQVLGQANVNAQELQDFIFPIPDLKTQNKIVQEIFKVKKAVNSLNEKAELNRKEAIKEFEQAIFKV
ncbi:MAG: restriction endonuclease subunit S [Spirochaetes bacterium]|nr:restriction endonuclease subunit S [Spirochaetota bacterium]